MGYVRVTSEAGVRVWTTVRARAAVRDSAAVRVRSMVTPTVRVRRRVQGLKTLTLTLHVAYRTVGHSS